MYNIKPDQGSDKVQTLTDRVDLINRMSVNKINTKGTECTVVQSMNLSSETVCQELYEPWSK